MKNTDLFFFTEKSKQILAYEIEQNDLRKELYLLKNKAYNLRNFSTFAAILKFSIHNASQSLCAHHPGRIFVDRSRVRRCHQLTCRSVTKLNLDTRCRKSHHANITGYSSHVNNPGIPLTSNSRLVGVNGGTVICE